MLFCYIEFCYGGVIYIFMSEFKVEELVVKLKVYFVYKNDIFLL